MAGLLAAAAFVAAASTAGASPPLRIEGMTFVASTGPVTELLVAADEALVDIAANRADLEAVRAQWAGADGRTSLELRCERGEFDLATNDLVAIGDVRGRLGDGREFRGPWLRYDRANGVAFTDAPVVIVDQGRQLRGGGLRYHVRDRRLRLTAGASVMEPK
jgi:LPS export ABC transporter protein LptC